MKSGGFRRLLVHEIWWLWYCCFTFAPCALANLGHVDDASKIVCSGMYALQDRAGGNFEPYITFEIEDLNPIPDVYDPGVTVAIFDYRDIEHIGVRMEDGRIQEVCDDYAIRIGLCKEAQKHHFIIQDYILDPLSSETKKLTNTVLTFSQDYVGLHQTRYPVRQTAYYCLKAIRPSPVMRFNAKANFRNAFGHLDAAEIDRIPLHGTLTLGYLLILIGYCIQFHRHRGELIPIQKYLLVAIILVVLESTLVWSYFEFKNYTGRNLFVRMYLGVVTVFSAGKITLSFYLLLLISMGYGVISPRLDPEIMKRCKIFGILTYIISVDYLLHSYIQNPESVSLSILFTAIPMLLMAFIFYMFAIRGLTRSMEYLKSQRQMYKYHTYKKMLLSLYFSLVVVFVGSASAAFIFIGMNTTGLIQQSWRFRFYVKEFWPSVIYFLTFLTFVYVWQPSNRSFMLTCSHQLSGELVNVVNDFELFDFVEFSGVEDNNDETLDDITNNDEDFELDDLAFDQGTFPKGEDLESFLVDDELEGTIRMQNGKSPKAASTLSRITTVNHDHAHEAPNTEICETSETH